ncbi:hypothetical protein EVAR_76181_1 [Eumeta japonica]|uniref:Integrase catalytic domain-containing protein n=1 Tax=Eumeta variegata TaxID=151549 RepID=A0A4C1UXA7_EUMVA|nr:hypothetical protein EVAR_76181_1 [Eumeta japonica]
MNTQPSDVESDALPLRHGLVERFHRQLKAAIVCHENANWVESLPLVLLGIRSALKEDLQTTSAELLYGEPLRLPGEFLDEKVDFDYTVDLTEFMSRLHSIVRNLRPSPASRHSSKRATFIFKDLATCSHVFLRDCTVGGSLKAAYTGPFEILQRKDKVFTILVNGKKVTVSIDRIKPAYILSTPHNTHTTLSHSTAHTTPQILQHEYNRIFHTYFTGYKKRCKDNAFRRRIKFPEYYRH